MAKVRSRTDNKLLFLDFYYRGVRCREQTALIDGAANRKKVQALLTRIQKEISQGTFEYAKTFPASSKRNQFASGKSEGLVSAAEADLLARSQPRYATTPVFLDFAEQWFLEMSPNWRRLHRDAVRDILDRNLIPRFGDQRVGYVSKADVLSFRAEIAKLPGRKGTLGSARINKIMCFLRQILNEAADRFDCPAAFRGVKPLKQKKSDVQPFSLDEVNRIVATIRSDYRNYIITRFFTGMRSGEINGLQWRYIDMNRNLILVRETLVSAESEDNAKNDQSLRDIPMQPLVREAIEAQCRTRSRDVPWVFATNRGGPIDTHNFANRVWYPLLRYLELDKRRPYQSRHTAATLMLASGENPEWVAKVLGHANTDMLFRVYSRFVPNLTRQDGRAFAGLLHSRMAGEKSAARALSPDALKKMSAVELRQALSQFLSQPNQS